MDVAKNLMKTLTTQRVLIAAGVLLVAVAAFFLWPRAWRHEGFEGAKGSNVFTMYYAEWCPHCKAVKPLFSTWSQDGATMVKGKPVFLKMVEEKEIDKSKAPKIDGYPTFVLQKEDGSTVTYEGDRTVEKWQEFLEQSI